jgi:hypothetical protein
MENFCITLFDWNRRMENFCIALFDWNLGMENFCITLFDWNRRMENFCIALFDATYAIHFSKACQPSKSQPDDSAREGHLHRFLLKQECLVRYSVIG